MKAHRTINNALWIIGCRIVQAVLNLLITMFTARFLGPSNFGLINYAMSIVAFVAPVMQLGFTSVLVQELITHPDEEGEILGTSIFSCCMSASLSIIGIVLFTLIANHGERETIIVCGLYSLTLLAQAFELILYWFQAHLLSKYSAVISLTVYFAVSAYKVMLLLTHKSVRWFAVSNALDFVLIAILLLVVYRKLNGQKLAISAHVFGRMFHSGKYYILSGLMVAVFAQTDRVMLKLMINDAATGLYSAAATCAGLTGFVFTAILDSARPAIFESHKTSTKDFEENVICLYSIIIFAALLQSVFITLLAKPIIFVLYGRAYENAIGALRIIVWYTTFSYIGSAKNIWILAEGKQRLIWKIDLPGAILNVILNAFLIPQFGVNGAAIASLITQIFTNIGMLSVFTETRRTIILIGKSLNFKNFVSIARRNLAKN